MITFQPWAERLVGSQKLNEGSPYLYGEAPPSRNQIAAVLHALADHTAITNMLAVCEDLGGSSPWPEATGIGRYYQSLGNAVELGTERESSETDA